MTTESAVLAQTDLRLDTTWIDYVFVVFYFVLVLGIGVLARRSIASSLDFLLSGRSLPAWVTGLAFISANLGAIELIGMMANGAEYGMATVHYYWIGAIPAMVFLGIVMMPFYYGSKARSVPEFLSMRFNATTQRVNGVTFAVASVSMIDEHRTSDPAADFTGRAVVITGAGSGIGRASARAFARAGASVLAVGRRADKLAETAAEDTAIVPFVADVRAEDAAAAVVGAAALRWGRVDVLVSNAGVFSALPLAEVTTARVRDVVDTNITAPSLLAAAALPLLQEQRGTIVNVSGASDIGLRPGSPTTVRRRPRSSTSPAAGRRSSPGTGSGSTRSLPARRRARRSSRPACPMRPSSRSSGPRPRAYRSAAVARPRRWLAGSSTSPTRRRPG